MKERWKPDRVRLLNAVKKFQSDTLLKTLQ